MIKDLEDLSEQTFDDSKKLKENLERYISKVEKEFKIADEKILIKFSSLQQEFNSFQLDVQDTYTPLSEQLKVLFFHHIFMIIVRICQH